MRSLAAAADERSSVRSAIWHDDHRAYAAAPRERDASAPIRSVSSSGGAELIMS